MILWYTRVSHGIILKPQQEVLFLWANDRIPCMNKSAKYNLLNLESLHNVHKEMLNLA